MQAKIISIEGVIMKKFLSAVLSVILLVPFISTPKANAINFAMKDTITSEAAILINLDSNVEITEKNADTKEMPGPLVNIMTAVICLENCKDLTETITIDPEVYQSVYEDAYTNDCAEDIPLCDLCDGDTLSISDLLYCMMLTSSVEASQSLAYHVGGDSVSKFVEMMNEKAKELGMTSTNFTNPTGMYSKDQYTTARDMAKLTQYALSVPLFETISTTFSYNPTVPNIERHENQNEWIWTHSNIMMDPENEDFYYIGAKGIKTANLKAGGRNIITMASRDGNNYLAILMKAPLSDADGNSVYYHLSDATKMFDWAFNHFSYQVVLANTAEVGELPVTLADGNNYVLAKPEKEFSLLWYDDIDTSLIKKDNITWYKDSIQAPVKKGEPLGEVTLEYSGEVLGTVKLVAVSDVDRSTLKYNIEAATRFKDSEWFKTAFKISGILCLVYILLCLYSWLVFKNKGRPVKPKYAVPKMDKKSKKNK